MSIRTYRVETWGCQMNVLDSQRLEGALRGRGLEPVEDVEVADVVLLNTCAVREKAVQKIVSRLGELRAIQQRTGYPRHVGLCGCVAEQEGAGFLDRLPVVSFVLGPGQIAGLGGALDLLDSGQRPALLGTAPGGSYQASEIARPQSRRQLVTAMHGCDQHCTYCVVPMARGREASRPVTEVVAEVRTLVAAGALEVTLLGQTVNAYRCPASGADLADLLESVTAVDGIWRVQILTSHPRYFDAKLIRALGTLPRLGTFLHMPCQAGADRTLKRMGRRYTRQQYLDLVAELRATAPHLTLSTDVIVGFPGETEEEFLETVDLVSRVRFGQVFGFVYSARRGTGAARLADRVPRTEAGQRLHRLFVVQNGIQLDLNRALVGKNTEVLVDGPARRGADLWHGRGADNRMVNFPSWDGIVPGELVHVTITGATPHALMGRRVEGDAP